LLQLLNRQIFEAFRIALSSLSQLNDFFSDQLGSRILSVDNPNNA
jgi:hypothetical protein